MNAKRRQRLGWAEMGVPEREDLGAAEYKHERQKTTTPRASASEQHLMKHKHRVPEPYTTNGHSGTVDNMSKPGCRACRRYCRVCGMRESRQHGHATRTYRDEMPHPTTTAPMVLLIVGSPDGVGKCDMI